MGDEDLCDVCGRIRAALREGGLRQVARDSARIK